MLIVLGLDSLDANRIESCPTPNIDSLVASGEGGQLNPGNGIKSDDLVTQVLWPSLLAGRHPKELFPSYYDSAGSETKSWENAILDSKPVRPLESVLAQMLPRNTKERLKRLLTSQGASKTHLGAKRLADHGSILDDAEAPHLISVPGINEDAVNTDLKSMIAPDGESRQESSYRPTVDMEEFERAGLRADSDRLIRTLNAIESRQYDFLMTHFFSLDLVQHIWADTPQKMKRWYGLYDDFIGQVQQVLVPRDTLLLVSDHGMKSTGVHSRRAFYACSKLLWQSDDWRLPKLRDVMTAELERHETSDTDRSDAATVDQKTRDHLEQLGYF